MAVIEIDRFNFEEEVFQAQAPVLLEFYASWCMPCKLLATILQEISEEHQDIKVCRMNVEEEMELAETFDIMNIPTLVYLHNGKVKDEIIGLSKKQTIEKLFE